MSEKTLTNLLILFLKCPSNSYLRYLSTRPQMKKPAWDLQWLRLWCLVVARPSPRIWSFLVPATTQLNFFFSLLWKMCILVNVRVRLPSQNANQVLISRRLFTVSLITRIHFRTISRTRKQCFRRSLQTPSLSLQQKLDIFHSICT